MNTMINGKKLGLALGSGGARGISHFGVLEVLQSNGLVPDMVAGCSIGAIAGAIYSVGTNLKLLTKYIATVDKKEILDPALPTTGGLLMGNKIEELVRVLTHDKCFCQTKIPFFCTATDMESGTLKVFSEGKLHRAVRASMCIPGVFVPVEIDGHLYGDGGLLQTIPTTVLREQGCDVVIAVDLSDKRNMIAEGKVNAYSTLLRAFDIMQEEMDRLHKPDADVYIRPQAAFMSLLSTEGTEQCVQEGIRAATEALPQIFEALGIKESSV